MSFRNTALPAVMVLVSLFSIAQPIVGDEAHSGIGVTPSLVIPLARDVTYFGTGGLAELSVYSRPAFAPRLVTSIRAGYGYSQLEFESSLSIVSVGTGLGLILADGGSVDLEVGASGGYYYGFLNSRTDVAAGGAYLDATLRGSVLVSPTLSLSFVGGYRSLLGLGQFALVGLGGRVRTDDPTSRTDPARLQLVPEPLDGSQPRAAPTRPLSEAVDARPLRVSAAEVDEIFPVLFKYYDEHPIGSLRLTNTGSDPISDLSLTLRVGRYMDSATACRGPSRLDGGRSADVEIMAFFNEAVLDITEPTKVNAEITINFVHQDHEYSQTYTHTIRLHDRNSMTWDDDRKPAAYVTARDPSVMTVAKMVSGIASEGSASPIPTALRTAMALHATVGLYGMTYTPDPGSPVRNRGEDALAIDYLQFPRQTLEYRGGDCDDISILYAALLESLGIPTAFILVPGHIFLGFDLGLTASEARRQFPRPEDLIFDGETAWVPLETTALSDGFLDAWQAGARQWREAEAREQAGLLPVARSWELYEPVGLLGAGHPLSLPPGDAVADIYRRELTGFVDRTIFPLVAELEERVRAAADPLPYRNRLAVLYGRYGLYDRARAELERILGDDREYVPAIINLANLHVLSDEPEEALSLFERALAHQPRNPRVLISLAQINHRMENYGTATRMFDLAMSIDPALAARFSYVEHRAAGSARADDRAARGDAILWEEDEP